MKQKKWLLVPTVLIIGLIGLYAFFAFYFQSHTLPRTTVDNITVERLTRTGTEEKLQKNLKKTSFAILDEKNEWKTIPGEELGISYDIKATTDQVFNKQKPFAWPLAFFKAPKSYPIKLAETDVARLDASLEQIKTDLNTYNKSQTPSKDAAIEFKDGKYQIVKEVEGTTVDVDKTVSKIKEAVLGGKQSLNLNEYIVKPKVHSNDEKLVAAIGDIERLSTQSVSYIVNGQKVEVPKEVTQTWFTFADNKVAVNKEKVTAYITELGQKYNTSTNPSKFKSTKQGEVSVPAGSYSWTIATNSETEALSELLLEGKGVTDRVPHFEGSSNPGVDLIGNTYIEIDLQAQHMWYYKDGKVALETPVITGKPSSPTPKGVFYVWNKKQNEILRGEDYAEPVDFWMPIDWTGVGIHDSAWQNPGAYGGTSYTTVGSHGCINTPPTVAKQLYNMIGVGVPVIVI